LARPRSIPKPDSENASDAKLIKAAVIASLETRAPILPHTDGVSGDPSLATLTAIGIPAHRINVGHGCPSPDQAYHRIVVDGGAHIGFDRFGMDIDQSDEVRIAGMYSQPKDGYADNLLVSHDCAFCQRGRVIPDEQLSTDPMHFSRNIAPRLRELGISDETLDSILTSNPRRYCEGEAPARTRVLLAADTTGP